MNQRQKLKALEVAQSKFQEAIVEFIHELLDIRPESYEMLLDCFNMTMKFHAGMVKHIAKAIILK